MLRAYLQLVRFPAVFTAMADIFLGFLLVRRGLQPALGFAMLLVASSCLYLAGMVFNDIFDRHVDARERPGRPIPSGRVSLTAALGVGIVLVLAGLGAARVAGLQSLLVAGVLTAMIFAYDGVLKKTPMGPIAMGLCRFLNVLLGASYLDPESGLLYVSWSQVALPVLQRPQLLVAAALGVYVAGVTWFARYEAKRDHERSPAISKSRAAARCGPFSAARLLGSSRAAFHRRELSAAVAVVNLGLAGLGVLIYGVPPILVWLGQAEPAGVLLALLLIAAVVNRRMIQAVLDPVPEKVQPAVKTLLLTLIVLDATLVYYHTASPGYALMTVALLAPALLLGRWVYVT